MTPMFIANAKSRMTPMPKMVMARVTKNTVAQVRMVRDRVSLIDGVDDAVEAAVPQARRVLADAVEDDDGVVHREAYDGQDRRHRGQRELLVGDRERADRRGSASWNSATMVPGP